MTVGSSFGASWLRPLVGPVVIEVARVVAKDLFGVAAVEQQDTVGALLSY
jgi:hypothetical protein